MSSYGNQWFASSGVSGFYDHQINQSLFLPRSTTDGLNRTLGTPTNQYKMTFSAWIKRAFVGNTNLCMILNTVDGGSGVNTAFDYATDDKLGVAVSGSYDGNTSAATLDATFTDTSAFMHLVIAYDTTDGTAGNRVKVYQNGTQLSGYTETVSQNTTVAYNKSGNVLYLGRHVSASYSLGGYIAEVVIIDGQQLAPTSFAEEKNGVWKPIDPSGLTFGNNGAYLKFEDTGNFGNDSSGNDNDFTSNGLSADQQSGDSPTFGS